MGCGCEVLHVPATSLTTRAEATDRQPKAPAAERRASRSLHPARALLAVVAGIPAAASAQDLEPRAYSPAPIGANFLGVLYQHSTGGASFDPSFPVKNARVTVEAPAVYYSRTFDLLGRQASAALVLPYAWADAKADVFDQPRAGRRSGSGDPRSRLAANLIGGPALDLDEFLKRPPRRPRSGRASPWLRPSASTTRTACSTSARTAGR